LKVIGITGGVGCGKSTVLSLIKEHFNAYILMTDEISRDLLQPKGKAYFQVVDMFGDSIVAADQTINRAALAQIIFHQPNKRIVLNSIIHPLVKQEVIKIITNLRIENKYAYVFVESALLFDDHYEIFCDETWYIYAPENMRMQRLMSSRGYSQEKVTAIMKSQLTEKEFRKKCDVIVYNDKTSDEVLRQLVKLL